MASANSDNTHALSWRARVVSVVGVAVLFALMAATGWAMTARETTVTTRSTTSNGALVSVSSKQVAKLRAKPAQAMPGAVTNGLPTPSSAWVNTVSAQTGIPQVAVAAYGRAALQVQIERPACRLSWPTLAGVGEIESDHGRSGGSAPDANGTVSPRILGPALDGSEGVAAIRATEDSTRWHGNPTWDHAVGPMQFIPSTWATWGTDASGDGAADPNNVNDAALAAGRYLCASGGDLTTGSGWTAAIFSYNQSDVYITDVYRAAARYAAATVG